MDSTKDSPRPGPAGERRLRKRNPPGSATGMNAGPERRAEPLSEDHVSGSTSAIEPELRGKPHRGSRYL